MFSGQFVGRINPERDNISQVLQLFSSRSERQAPRILFYLLALLLHDCYCCSGVAHFAGHIKRPGARCVELLLLHVHIYPDPT